MIDALTKNTIKTQQIKDTYKYFVNEIQQFIKELIERILEFEIEQQRTGYQQKMSRQRNGYYRRSLVTEYGLIEDIKVPRYRGIKFINSFFKPWQRRLKMVDDFVTQIFIQGHSYRDIKRIFRMMFKDSISLRTINKIIDKTLITVDRFHNRNIEKSVFNTMDRWDIFPGKTRYYSKEKGEKLCCFSRLGIK